MGVTSSGVDALSTPTSHAVYQSSKESLWYCLPHCHKHTGQICMIGRWGLVTLRFTSQLVPCMPCMLIGVQIWRILWPMHPVDIVLPKKVCSNSCTMRSGRRTNTLDHSYDKGLDNLLQIAISVQVTVNDIKRSLII